MDFKNRTCRPCPSTVTELALCILFLSVTLLGCWEALFSFFTVACLSCKEKNTFYKIIELFYWKGKHIEEFHGYRLGTKFLVNNTKSVAFKWVNVYDKCMINVSVKERMGKESKLYYLYVPNCDSVKSH